MLIKDRLKNYPRFNSIKGEFVWELYKAMAKDKRIILVTADLGYKMFDPHREDMPDQYIDVGAAEQTLLGVGIGLALSGKIPFVHSITNFLVYRPFEWIRNYVNYEKIPVKLIGGGLDKEYLEDGITHQCEDLKDVLGLFKNIEQLYPNELTDVAPMVEEMIENELPYFMGVSRGALHRSK
jgi:transketolase